MVKTLNLKFDQELPAGVNSVSHFSEPVNLVYCVNNFIRRAVRACDHSGVPYYLPLRRFICKGSERSEPLFGSYFFTFGHIGATIEATGDCSGVIDIVLIKDALIMPQLITVEQFLGMHPDGKANSVLPKGIYMKVTSGPYSGLTVIVERAIDSGRKYLVINAINAAIELELSEAILERI